MDLLVTDLDKKSEGLKRITFDEFFVQATSENGLDDVHDLWIDINSIPDEDTYQAISQSGADINWITFEDEDELPEWFDQELSPLPNELNDHVLNDNEAGELASAMSMLDLDPNAVEPEEVEGKIIVFGSAKGGSGKTFTALITAYYYAKEHPDERVCIIDLDIEEPQMGIVIKKLQPTVKAFYPEYLSGNTTFDYLKKCATHNSNFPKNLDFYLTPREAHPIRDKDFWQCIMMNLFMNYDMVFLDTGTTYMETDAIVTAYRVADKVNLVTMANLASTVTVAQQINRLTGEEENNVYSPEDKIEGKLNLIVTNSSNSKVCSSIVAKLNEECPIVATFGNLSDQINDIQVLGKWSMFDNNKDFREAIRDIYSV